VVMWQHNVSCVCMAFFMGRYVGLGTIGVRECMVSLLAQGGGSCPTYLPTQNATHTHQTLCCHITTIDRLHF